MNPNSKPTSGLNSFKSKYHWRISSTSVIAFQTFATGALKVRSMTIASATLFFVVMVFLFRFRVWFDDSKDVTGRIFRIGKPADFRYCHLRDADFSATLLNLLHRL